MFEGLPLWTAFPVGVAIGLVIFIARFIWHRSARIAAGPIPHRHLYHVCGLATLKNRSDRLYTGICECGKSVDFHSDTWRHLSKEMDEQWPVIFDSLALDCRRSEP